MVIHRIPEEVLLILKETYRIEKGECFTNSGLATLLSISKKDYSEKLKNFGFYLEYSLGFLFPPNQNPVAHAWIKANRNENIYHWDPTLQVHSPSWNKSSNEFHYKSLHIIDPQGLHSFLREKYHDFEFSKHGIPIGNCRFPIINSKGEIE